MKMYFLLKMSFFHCHVSSPGVNSLFVLWSVCFSPSIVRQATLSYVALWSLASTVMAQLSWVVWIVDWGVTIPETDIAPENEWLEDEFPLGFRPIFRDELLVFGRVILSLFTTLF